MLCIALLIAILPCMAQEFPAPVIKLNSSPLNCSEVNWSVNKPFILSCDGQAAIIWKTKLWKHQKHVSRKTLSVQKPTTEYTGTYRCCYKSQADLYSQIHIYVKDSVKAFTTPQSSIIIQKEGSNYLLDCLVTNPESTDFSLQMVNGSTVPSEMNYTADPKRGILIRNLQPSYNGDYVCTVKMNGVQKKSDIFQITVIRKAQQPPAVSLPANQYVRIVGETLHIPCHIENQDHSYNITWSSSEKVLNYKTKRDKGCEQVCIISLLTIHQVNMSDTGNLTCTGQNEAGKSSATAVLKVIGKPHIKLKPILSTEYKVNGTDIEVMQGDNVELSVQIEAYPEDVGKLPNRITPTRRHLTGLIIGMSPYPNVMIDAQFYKMIKDGYHMPQPDFAPHEMYTIMKMCWSLEPTLRPTFANIRELIAKLLPKKPSQEVKASSLQQSNEDMYPELQRNLMEKQCDTESVCRDEAQPLMRSSLT